MSLLKDVIKDATAGEDVAKLLRKCMVLAHILHSAELTSWAKAELNGYDKEAELPSYRQLSCRAMGQMVGPLNMWHGTFEIPLWVLPKKMQNNFSMVAARAPVAHYESLVTAAESQLMQPWPTELARQFAPKAFVKGTQCLKAWNAISSSEVKAMLDQIKSRVLEFGLLISTEFPELCTGDELLGSSVSKEAQVNQTFNTTIMGSVGNYASGSTNVTQESELVIALGDLEALRKALGAQGLPQEQISSLEAAIEADKDAGETGMGSRVKLWLGELTALAVTGSGAISVNAIGGAIAPLVGKFLGLA